MGCKNKNKQVLTDLNSCLRHHYHQFIKEPTVTTEEILMALLFLILVRSLALFMILQSVVNGFNGGQQRALLSRSTRITAYRFGDISKFVGKNIAKGINKITGKSEYRFGDLSFWLDAKSKELVAGGLGKDSYEFGDLSRLIDSRVKDSVNALTGKEKYEFGDLTKEITQRVLKQDYTLDDLALLMKALLSFGVGLSPVASFLPITLLVRLLNYSIASDVSNKLTASLAFEVDRRVKKALTGDSDYKIGDLTKRAILRFTGKAQYTAGDITRAILDNMDARESAIGAGKPSESSLLFSRLPSPEYAASAGTLRSKSEQSSPLGGVDPEILSELAQWDAAFAQTSEQLSA